jgi:hypothetical protein
MDVCRVESKFLEVVSDEIVLLGKNVVEAGNFRIPQGNIVSTISKIC